MAKIIVTAENFAFGPIGKLLTITNDLYLKGHELVFVGYGTAYQLASKGNFSKIIEMDTDSPNFFSEAKSLFEKCDLLISAMDRSSVLLAQSISLPVIWLDTLFWWWDEIPDFMLNVDCYIKQNTLSDNKNLKRYASRIKNLYGVGPIVDLSVLKNVNKKNQVIVAFGGMEGAGWYQIGKDSNYPFTISEMLVNKVDFKDFEKVLITGNEKIIKDLARKNNNNKFEFKTLGHDAFIQEIANSSIAIMVPGLETPLESFSYKIPTIFLPPSNSSQYVQLDTFIKEKTANLALHFADYYQRLYLSGRNLREIMREFLDQLHVFEKDLKVQSDMAKRISKFLCEDKLLKKQVSDQSLFIKNLGGNGKTQTLTIITTFISNISNSKRRNL